MSYLLAYCTVVVHVTSRPDRVIGQWTANGETDGRRRPLDCSRVVSTYRMRLEPRCTAQSTDCRTETLAGRWYAQSLVLCSVCTPLVLVVVCMDVCSERTVESTDMPAWQYTSTSTTAYTQRQCGARWRGNRPSWLRV